MNTPAQHLTELVARARDAAGHTDSPIPLEPCVPTGNPDHGDYQSNFAFRLGKSLRTNPRQVAQQIVEALPDDPAVKSADVAGPGFINFRLDEDWLAEQLSTGTIKYFDLSQNPQSNITFTWDSALSLEGNTAVYLMYAYARLHSILRKAGVDHTQPTALPSLDHPAERAMGLLAAQLPAAIEIAAESYKPSWLAEHLFNLARAVGPFYQSCPVLKDGVAPDLRDRRLALVAAVAQGLKIGMKLLGLRPIERM